MSKRSLKSKRRSKALPALSFAGASLSMASGACASTSEASVNTPPTSQSQNQEIFLGEEEIFDVSLTTFYVFDKENGRASPLAQHLKLARGGCGGCGHGGGCGGHGGGCGGHGCGCGHGGLGGCGHGCGGFHGGCRCGGFHGGCRCGGRIFRGCGGCGCGGCGGCGICWTWPWVGWCWGESTAPAEVASVASEQSAQTVEVAVKKVTGKIDGMRAK
jgi:hypothetical protein